LEWIGYRMAKSRSNEHAQLRAHRNFKIVSGGQTGADRAALDFAIEHRIRHGGWCPNGRLAEDGRIAKRYRLKETESAYPAVRTGWNVRESDGTVIFSLRKRLTGGTRLTEQLALRYKKPLLKIVAPGRNAGRALACFIRKHDIGILNVAGPRESGQVGVYAFTRRVLKKATDAFGARPD
jgi:hypothetical protein